MIEQAFEVATEFKFDIGQALLNTKTLQDAVSGVSQAADSAMGSLSYLAGGLVAHLGMGSGGLLSVLTKAVQVSEDFNQSALMLSNNISSNFGVLAGTIDTFNNRLLTSENIMSNISDIAIKSGLPTQDLARMTGMLATPLANRGKLGTNYEGAIGMSRNLMLAANNTGINPQVASESLYRAMTDHMSLHGALFARMVNTPAFKSAHIATQGQFVNMNQDKKIDLLNKSLEQLAGDSQQLAGWMNKIGTQFTILKDQLAVFLKPIGDALKAPIVQMLKWANEYLKLHGKELGNNIAALFKDLLKDPKGLMIDLLQVKRLGKDFKTAFHVAEIVQLFTFLTWGLGKLGIVFNGGLLRSALGYLWEGITAIAAWIWESGLIGGMFRLLANAGAAFLEVFAPILFFLQIFSRALAIAKVDDAANLLDLAPRLVAMTLNFKQGLSNIMLPLTMAIDGFAQLIAPIFQTSTWLNLVLPLLEWLGEAMQRIGHNVVYLMGVLSGFTNIIVEFIGDLITKGHLMTGADTKNAFYNGYDDFLKRNKDRLGDPGTTAQTQVTNIGKVEIRNEFREQLQPDRIAFSLKQQLLKVAQNPTQARGRSFQGAFAGGTPTAGSK